MPRVSFTSATLKLWLLFLHPKSAHICEYSPMEKSQNPRVIQIYLHHLLNYLCTKFDLRLFLSKQSRCPGHANYTGDSHQEADHCTFHRLLVFVVPAFLLG